MNTRHLHALGQTRPEMRGSQRREWKKVVFFREILNLGVKKGFKTRFFGGVEWQKA